MGPADWTGTDRLDRCQAPLGDRKKQRNPTRKRGDAANGMILADASGNGGYANSLRSPYALLQGKRDVDGGGDVDRAGHELVAGHVGGGTALEDR